MIPLLPYIKNDSLNTPISKNGFFIVRILKTIPLLSSILKMNRYANSETICNLIYLYFYNF